MRAGLQRRADFAAHRIVEVVNAQGALCIAAAEAVGRDQHQQQRLVVERVANGFAPGPAGGQIFLVEEDLRVAEHFTQIARQRGGFVRTIAGAVADENSGAGHTVNGACATKAAAPPSRNKLGVWLAGMPATICAWNCA